jgi:hypothetical protein
LCDNVPYGGATQPLNHTIRTNFVHNGEETVPPMKRIGPLLAMVCAVILLGVAIVASTTAPVGAQAASPHAPVASPAAQSSSTKDAAAESNAHTAAPADTPSPTNTPTGCTDIFEPDNNLGSASTLIVPQTQSHSFCKDPTAPNNDEDWAKVINLQAFTVYDFRTDNLGSNVDTIVSLYDSAGAFLASNDDETPGSRNSSLIYTTTTGATLYVQVVNKSSLGGFGPTWAYNLTVQQIAQVTPTSTTTETNTPTETPTPTATATGSPQPTATPACLDVYEPDNNFSQAQRIGVNDSQNHILCSVTDPTHSGDVDVVYFSANSGVAYDIATKNLANDTDTKIELYNTSQHLIDSNDNCPNTGDLSSCLNNEVFNSAGIYYIRVYDPRPQGGGLGHTYTLQLTGGAANTATATASVSPTPILPTITPLPGCLDDYENDGVPAAAKLLLINSTQHHTFCPTGDADWVMFFAKSGKTYSIATTNLGIGVDTYIYLFDSSLTAPLASNDDYNGSLASRIDFSPVADGQFYVQIKDQGDVGGPDATYDLSLLAVPGGVPGTFPPTPANGTAVPSLTPQPIGSGTPSLVPTFTLPPQSGPTDTPASLATAAPTDTLAPGQPTDTPAQASPTPTSLTETQPTPPIEVLPTQPPFPGSGHPLALASVAVQVFVDHNGNGVFDSSEGISHLLVAFIADDGTADASVTTDAHGSGEGVIIPYAYHRISIPYLGIVRNLFAGIEPHDPGNDPTQLFEWDIALPPPVLPNRIP